MKNPVLTMEIRVIARLEPLFSSVVTFETITLNLLF
jgi:hypothetical protein